MRFLRRFGFFLLVLGLVSGLQAQSTTPAVKQAVPAQALTLVAGAATLDLRGAFELPGVTGQVVQFDTVSGKFNVELLADAAPKHVDNFLRYVNAGSYVNSFFHRTDTLDGTSANSIVQGGGYVSTGGANVATVAKFAPVALEYRLPNARGTLAAARTADVNSATSEWYFNTRDNSTILGQNNGGGYTVFGRVLGNGMSVLDAIAALPHPTPALPSPFNSLPARNYTNGASIDANNLVIVNSIVRADTYPAGSGPAVLTFTAQSSAPNVVSASVANSTLTLTPLAVGSATIIVTATDTHGSSVSNTVAVTVTSGSSVPVITAQPQLSVTVAGGTAGTVVFAVNATGAPAPTYQWRFNDVDLPGRTGATLVLSSVTAAQAGAYTCVVKNDIGTVTSQAGVLGFATTPTPGRLVNLSILTTASAGAKALTMGATIGGTGTAGAMPLVIRAVGPTLGTAPFNIGGVLPDPVMTLNAAGNASALAMNDDWGSSQALVTAFANVGAFALPANSLDAAIVPAAPGLAAGGYTVQVTGKGSASGLVIAEMYDAAGTARTAATPRLTNLSTLTQIDAGSTLAVGFVIGGNTARTLLVRGVGPTLGGAPFNIGGTMADPKLELFNNTTGQKILENNDWGGDASLSAVSSSVGAFALASAATKDAVLVVTLPPGQYSARVSGADGGGGTAIVEVYEVP